MKKRKKPNTPRSISRPYKDTNKTYLVSEPEVVYETKKRIVPATAVEYKKFKSMAAKIPFTLKEWASIIDLSDRTLQRYANDNKAFEGIYADRLSQIEKVLHEAEKVFTSPVHFYNWLKEEHIVFNHILSPASLQTQDGIQMVLDELGRMQQGVYI